MPYLIIAYLVLINIVAFAAFAVDKGSARTGRERIPELSLMLLAALGGAPGALIAMYALHHKTQKPKFYIGIPVILALELLAAAALLLKLKGII